MKNFLFLFSFLFFIQCQQPTETTEKTSNHITSPKGFSAYEKEILNWRKTRFHNLTKAQSWTSLAGLMWLAEGENRFGSDKYNKVIFPEKAPAVIGSIFKEGDSVYTKIDNNLAVKNENRVVTELALNSDVTGNPTILKYESFIWHIIKREEKYGVRLWDTLHENRTKLTDLKYYSVQEKWKIPAKFVKYDKPKTVPFYNVLAMSTDQKVEGKLVFEMREKTHELEVLNGGEKDFFVIFADTTTGDATYGGGRYIYVSRPDENGDTFIDFNKAYTPPCGFTEFATCLLPPAQNRLDLVVDVGEKYVGDH